MGNFRDPVGLAVRLVREGGAIGRQLLAREVLSKACAPFDLLLSVWERRLMRSDVESERPLVLIVGPPRSGTTLVHQVLAYGLDVGYFSNLNGCFPRAPVTAARLFDRRRLGPTSDFHSLYGNTKRLGDVCDAFHVWNRFLGSDRYEAHTDVSNEEQRTMRRFFAVLTTMWGKPLLSKNNRNLACASWLAQALPQARFVAVRRDPRFVAQSLLTARQWVQGDVAQGWGLNSTDSAPTDGRMGHVHAVCNQVQASERQLNEQRSAVGDERWLEISYEQFCSDPGELINQIVAKFSGVRRRAHLQKVVIPRFTVSRPSTLADDELRLVQQRLGIGQS